MYKSILFTHDDMDGIGCKLIYNLAARATEFLGPDDTTVILCSNKQVDGRIMDAISAGLINGNTRIIISDICPSLQTLVYLDNAVKSGQIGYVRIYDHHKTNEYARTIIPDAVIVPENDMGILESGTSLIYQRYVHDLEQAGYDLSFIYALVETIRSYDTYEWKQTNNIQAKKLNILFGLIGPDNFYQKYYDRIINGKTEGDLIDPNDMLFVNCKYDYENKVISNFTTDDVIDVNIQGYKVAFLCKSIPANTSELSYQFLEKNPEYDAMASFSLYNGGEFSFRTIRSDLDTGKIFAAPIGGGGHPKASGAPCPDSIKEIFKDILIRRLNGANVEIQTTSQINYSYPNQQ